MVITYHGLQFFKVTFADTTLAFNPVSKSSEYKSSSFGSDIVLISLNNKDFNGWETASRGEKDPFVVRGPGEYEYKNIFIQGFPSESNYNGEKKINTFYNVQLEDMTLCFLGALDDVNLKEHLKPLEVQIDILFLPIGGNGVLGPEEAYKTAVSLGSKIIIPMHYNSPNSKNSLKTFLNEGGVESIKSIDKLTIKKKDLVGKDGEIVVLTEI